MTHHTHAPKHESAKNKDHTPRASITDGTSIPNLSLQLSADGIITLQRTIGNQRVMQLLRNQSIQATTQTGLQSLTIARAPDTALGLLTPAEVQSAISYHTSQPWRYTPAIIAQIQAEVGTTPTGKMSAGDVQAIANRQKAMNDAGETPKLVVDGKAGPRTLPSVFKIGLATEESIDKYSEEAKEILANPENKTDEQLALDLCAQANERLTKLNIPALEFAISSDIGGRGTFRAHEWKLYLHTIQFTDPKFKDMHETTATIYHEARHAEQAYRIAQMLAGKNNSVETIVAETGIREDIVEIASQPENHIQPGTMEAVIAEGWHESLHSDASKKKIAKNNAAMDKAFAEREAAKKAYADNPSAENKAKLEVAKANYQKTIDFHKDMPHEFDAERVEDKVKKQLE